jgi:Cytochrome c7 and related cytochrome c
MPTNRETGKDRWKRVPKDYFKKPDGLQRTKLRFSALALFLVLAWCALGMDWTGRSGKFTSALDLRANHGTLAKVHSAWDHKCEACHVPFEPIDGRPLLATSSSAVSRTSDRLCMSCHAGPIHHTAIRESDIRSCAECHRDHRGREASLVKLDDVECTRCHASLKDYLNKDVKPAGAREFADEITRFDLKHPPFRPNASTLAADNKTLQDRGGLKFNHALHMTPGIVKKPGDTPYTVKDIPVESERSRYGKSEKEAVTLDCSSCHVLEASDLKSGPNPSVSPIARPVRSDGKYYQPVSFETQCRACHDLNFDPRSPAIRAPHGVQPEIVVAFLRKTFAAQLFDEKPNLLEKFVPGEGLPGKTPVESSLRQDFEGAILKAEQVLFGENKQSCHECHESVKDEGSLVPKQVVATNVPAVWFTHAAFDHTAHRGVSCRDCHAQSYAMESDGVSLVKDASRSGKDVNLPDLENCRKCHAPAGRDGGWLPWSSPTNSTGGVAHNCTECHTYHNGDHSLAGVGARAEDATTHRQIEQFLLGKGRTPVPSQVGKPTSP